MALCRRAARRRAAGLLGLLLVASASCAGPKAKAAIPQGDLLCSFESAAENSLATGTASFQTVASHATKGSHSMQVDLNAAEATFGLRAQAGVFNFTGAVKLKFDVYRPGDPCHLTLRVFDQREKRYVAWYALAATGASTLEFDVHGMSSEIDVAQITEFVFYADQPVGVLFVDNIRLTRGPEDDEAPPPAGKPDKPVPGNLIKNGGFELGLYDWESWGEWDEGKYLFGTAQGQAAHSGAAAAAIIAKKIGRGGVWSQPIYLPTGNYELRLSARGIGRDVKMFWTFDGDGKQHIVTGLRSNPFAVGESWKTTRFAVGVARQAAVVRLYLFSVGGGTLLLDDVALVNTDRPAAPASAQPRADLKPRRLTVDGVRTVLDGEPFFPIGIFNGRPDKLAGTGFNFIVAGMPDAELLDACVQARVMICPNLQGVMRAHLPWQAPKVVEPLMNHPAVLAWYLCDEPDHSGWTVPPAEMRRATRLLNQADPNHPVWTVVMPWADSNIYQYADTVNILSTDVYPFADGKKDPLETVAAKTLTMRRAVKDARPVWTTTQWTKAASPEQNRAMTYLALAAGANGIVYWEFYEASGDPARWKAAVDVSLELKSLTPVLTLPTSRAAATISHPAIRAIVKEIEGQLYVIAVNSSPERLNNVDFAIANQAGARTARILFEKRSLPVREGRFSDGFGPYERHVYEIPVPN